MEARSQLIYRYLQVAISMVLDLHLTTDLSMMVRQGAPYASEARAQTLCDKSLDRSHEAYRAALGCFYLSSV